MTRTVRVVLGGHPGLVLRPSGARWLYVLAHGAGAGMRHPFLAELAAALARRSIATARWELPYMAAGRRRPDSPAVCAAAVREVCAAVAARYPELGVVAGGKSFGGRMTTVAAAEAPLPGVAGLVLVGFPLHPAKRPATTRAAHLPRVGVPSLFVSGTRDDLADLALLGPVVRGLVGASLVEITGADHGFAARPARPGVVDELAAAIAAWVAGMPRGRARQRARREP